jgi:sugar phosphate isomerase/epimerase
LFREKILGGNLLDQIARAGFDRVEIFCLRQHFDYTNVTHVREIAGWFSGSAVKLHSLHAPLSRDPEGTSHHAVVSIAFLERQRRQDSMDEIKRVLEVAERVPFRFLITHLGIPGEEYDLRKFDAALTSLEHLSLFAVQRGVEILVENIPNELSTPRRLLEFRRHTHLNSLRLCFDTGHAQMEGDVCEALRLLREWIASTHLHDNGGAMDDHRFPFDGVMDWEKTIRELRAVAPDVPLLLEVRGAEGVSDGLGKAAEVMDKLERIPLEVGG